MSKESDESLSDEARRWNEFVRAKPIGGILREHGGHQTLFQNYAVRRLWHAGEWWYSIIDCMEALTDSPNPRNYWSMMKRRLLAEEQLDVYTLGVQKHKLPDPNGKMRETDCANAEILLRLIQSVRSPKAEPFKIWLARVGAMVMDIGEERTLRAQHRRYLDKAHRDLHQLVTFFGVVTPADHSTLDDASTSGLYKIASEMELARRRSLLPGMLHDAMGSTELLANALQRSLTSDLVRDRQLEGIDPIAALAREVGGEIRAMLARTGSPMPEDMPRYPLLPPGEWMEPGNPNLMNWDAVDEVSEGDDPPILLIEMPKPSDSDDPGAGE